MFIDDIASSIVQSIEKEVELAERHAPSVKLTFVPVAQALAAPELLKALEDSVYHLLVALTSLGVKNAELHPSVVRTRTAIERAKRL